MPKRKMLTILLLFVLLLAAAGCRNAAVSGGTGGFVSGGAVVIGLREEPANLNPLVWRPVDDVDAGSLIFSGLFRRNEANEVVPDLAAIIPSAANGGITVDGAGMTVIYRLRADVAWHDGAPFTADDVVFTGEACRDAAAVDTRYGVYAAVTEIQALNAQTVRVRLSRRDIEVTDLFDRIIPAHLLRESEDMSRDSFSRSPVGTGPFRFTAWTPRDRIVLRANSAYYGEGPYLDAIIFELLPDATAGLNALKTGQIDLCPHLDPGQTAGLAETYGVNLHPLPSRRLDALVFRSGSLADIRVRQAMAAALDRDDLVAMAYNGFGRAAGGFRPEDVADGAARNLARSAQLLSEAGWQPGEDGIRTRYGVRLRVGCIVAAGDAVQEQAAEQMAAQMREAGIEFVPIPLATTEYTAAINGGTFETALIQYDLPAEFDPYRLWHSSQVPPAGQNYGRFRNTQIDLQLKEARALADPAVREQEYEAIRMEVAEALPAIPLVFPAAVDAAGGRLQNYRPGETDRLWNAAQWRAGVPE
ncbi:MAG: peptide ABC transporter substrate-binding protein [bacterium]|jgi:peptide/nickel transport system substrate-binding protein